MRRRFASPSTEKPRFLCLFQRKSPHNFCTKILHRTSCDRVGWSGCRLPQISPISTDKLHSACEESVFICRADDWQAPRWHLCSSVRSVGEKSTAWPIPHSIIPHPTDHSTFHIPRSTFHIPHSTLYHLSLGSCQSSRYHSAPIAVAPLTPAPTICGVCGPQRCASPFPQMPLGKGFPPAHIIVLQW